MRVSTVSFNILQQWLIRTENARKVRDSCQLKLNHSRIDYVAMQTYHHEAELITLMVSDESRAEEIAHIDNLR